MKKLACAVFACALPAFALAASPFSYQTVRVAEGIYAVVEPFGNAVVSGNTLAIVGDSGIVVVDTGHHPDLTRRVAAEIRALSPKPVQYVINTHWHNDHVAGNFVYTERIAALLRN
jgi:cyclase